ncbi:nucleobase-ascorbate transporter 4-like [Pistacia vera]|uniref:nucleobase-ascorbate transporter 4-like n=1 Tax=Pistacia vera TaxID=55513 RepID=UPI001262D6BE|nr:nucleobase-ascorbate transporter 4-like [Pistacia vera]
MAAAGGGPKPKLDEFQPHPVKDQLPGVDFCVSSSPSWAEAAILGFQHYLVMLGTTVLIPTILVPLMGGGNREKAEVINTLLFVAGLNTLTQTLFGTRLPVVMGGSYAFIIPTVSIAISNRFNMYIDPHQRFKQSMRAIQGALIMASLFHMIIGFFGFWRIFGRFLNPLAAVPLVTLTGLGFYALGFPQLAKCIEIGLPALLILVLISQYFPHLIKSRGGIIERFAVLFTVAIVWGYAEVLTLVGAYDKTSPNTQFSCRTDRSGLISAAPWIRVPYPFQWGGPSFNAGDSFAMMASSLVAIIESTGTFIAASRYGSATPMPPSVLSRGIGWQGIGILLDGLFGTGSGTTASVENAGLLGLTRNGSRRVVQISALFMIFFSVLGKFGAVLASIPFPIVAALYCVLFAYVASAGLGFLQFCNLNSFRTKFIIGFSLFMGLSVPQYFNEYIVTSGRGPVHSGSTAFNNIFQVIFSSPATVAIMVAYFLDCTHSVGHSATRRDSGRHWWVKFRYFERDTRSEEFYSLPFNLNRFFPSF